MRIGLGTPLTVLFCALVVTACGGSSGGGDTPSEAAEPIPFQRDAGTLALWHLDEGLGQTAFDVTFAHINLQLGSSGVGDAQDPAWIADSHLDSGLAFAADDDAYAVNAIWRTFQTDEMSVELWFRATAPTGHLFELAPDVCVLGWGGATFFFRIDDGATAHTASITDPTVLALLTDGLWHYLAATYDGTTMRIYIDGTERATQTTNPLPPSVTNIFLGGNPAGGQTVDGEIDEVRLSSRGRSAAEIEAHWIASSGG